MAPEIELTPKEAFEMGVLEGRAQVMREMKLREIVAARKAAPPAPQEDTNGK